MQPRCCLYSILIASRRRGCQPLFSSFFFLISYLRWCLELVRTRVTGCVSALWPLNPGLTEPEMGTLGKHKPSGMALFRGQRGWGGGHHMCSASFSHPHSLLSLRREWGCEDTPAFRPLLDILRRFFFKMRHIMLIFGFTIAFWGITRLDLQTLMFKKHINFLIPSIAAAVFPLCLKHCFSSCLHSWIVILLSLASSHMPTLQTTDQLCWINLSQARRFGEIMQMSDVVWSQEATI